MQLNLINSRHSRGTLKQRLQRLLSKIAHPNPPALRTNQLLHHLPRLNKRWRLAVRKGLHIWCLRAGPVDQKQVDVLHVQCFEGDLKSLCWVMVQMAEEFGQNGDF